MITSANNYSSSFAFTNELQRKLELNLPARIKSVAHFLVKFDCSAIQLYSKVIQLQVLQSRSYFYADYATGCAQNVRCSTHALSQWML